MYTPLNRENRPAVVISSAAYNNERPDIIIMAVTSQIKTTPIIGEVMIQHWQAAGLPKPSVIKPVMTTIEKLLILQTIGRLSDEDLQGLKESLTEILG